MSVYLRRPLADVIRRCLESFPVVTVTGPRQSGKTTLLRNEFGETFRYASLDDPDVRASCLEDPRAFLDEHAPPCILDEIQHAPELLSYIKARVDDRRRPGQWILSGSQLFALMQGVSESLAGRTAVLELHGLSQEELRSVEQESTADELLVGSFPEPRLHGREPHQWMRGYYQTYVTCDVRQVVNIGDLTSFEQFVRLCAARTAKLLNYAELARDAAVSTATAKRWLSVLEAGGQFFRLPPWTRSATKRMTKAPKLYAADTGLAAFLTGHRDADVLWHGPMRGALFETLVINEVRRYFSHRGDSPWLYYWRSSDGLEVDCVIEVRGRLQAIEVKSNATPMPRMGDELRKWRHTLGERAGRCALICDCERKHSIGGGIEAVPWRRTSELLDSLAST